MLAVVPLTIFGNLLRVLATVAGANAFGVERVTSGPVHDSAGVLSYILACPLLIGFGGLLRLLSQGPQRA